MTFTWVDIHLKDIHLEGFHLEYTPVFCTLFGQDIHL